jgi:penicillin G amidase
VRLVLLASLLIGSVTWVYFYRVFPLLYGEQQVPGLAGPVGVACDHADVTHIQAQSARDAWLSLGYVHAQERRWQMEFNLRVMHGDLCEVFGLAALDTDKLLRTLGIAQVWLRRADGS